METPQKQKRKFIIFIITMILIYYIFTSEIHLTEF